MEWRIGKNRRPGELTEGTRRGNSWSERSFYRVYTLFSQLTDKT